jgi:Tol biopolymer transport system component
MNPQLGPKGSAGRGILLLARESDLISLTPDGTQRDRVSGPQDTRTTQQGRLSPDGLHAVFVINAGAPRGPGDNLEAPWPYQVIIRKLGSVESKVIDFSGHGVDVVWAPDGKRLAVTKFNQDRSTEAILLDPATGKTEALGLPAGVRVVDWSRDGKTFLVTHPKNKKHRLGLAEKGDNEVRELTELSVRFASNAGRFSPDGKKVLFTDADPKQEDAHKWHRSSQPHILDIATKRRQPLADFPLNGQCVGVAWSPDGKQVAYTWTQLHADVLKKDTLVPADWSILTEAFVVIADVDGKNAKTVTSDRSNQALNPIYGALDWR